jgi:hypothetical protein
MSKPIVNKGKQKTAVTPTHENCLKSSEGKCVHTIIHKVPMKGRNVNGNRPIREKGTLVIKLDKKFKRNMAVLCRKMNIKSPTDVCRTLVADMANQYKSLKKSNKEESKKLTD